MHGLPVFVCCTDRARVDLPSWLGGLCRLVRIIDRHGFNHIIFVRPAIVKPAPYNPSAAVTALNIWN